MKKANSKPTKETILALTEADVQCVYSGKRDHCACGCVGIYRYHSDFLNKGKEIRGYELDSNEINDSFIRRVLKMFKANVDDVVIEDNSRYWNFFTYYKPNSARMYVVHLRKE